MSGQEPSGWTRKLGGWFFSGGGDRRLRLRLRTTEAKLVAVTAQRDELQTELAKVTAQRDRARRALRALRSEVTL